MCGYCGNQFNALEELSDAPVANENTDQEQLDDQKVNETDLDDTIEEEQTFHTVVPEPEALYENTDGEPVSSKRTESQNVLNPALAALIIKTANDTEVEKEFTFAEETVTDEDEQLEELIHDLTSNPFHETEDDTEDFENELRELSNELVLEEEPVDDFQLANSEYAVEYYEEETETPGRSSYYLWASGVLFLLLVGTTQALWFNRDSILPKYPQLYSYVKQLCSYANCSVYRDQDLSKIKLVSRDVRLHPRIADSLLVNAVMANQSDANVAYPNIQLSLYDTDGRMVSYRRFKPGEYLDDNIDVATGMQANAPVHFVLELAGHVEPAVSFEFDFY